MLYLNQIPAGTEVLTAFKLTWHEVLRLLVLIASCFLTASAFAITGTFGILYVALLEKFQEDRAKTATVQALLVGLRGSTGFIWGLLCRKLGLWKVMLVSSILFSSGFIVSFFAESLYHIIFCTGLLSGIGTSVGFVCSSAAVARTFRGKGAGIALAIHNSTIGLGQVVYPYFMNFLLQMYGINGTFLILGGVNLNILIVALIYFYRIKDESEADQTVENSEASTKFTVIELIVRTVAHVKSSLSRIMNIRLTVIILATSIADGCFNGFLVVVLDMFESKGFSVQEVLYFMTVFNLCSVIGRLLPVLSQLTDGIHPIAISIVCSILGCAGQMVFLKAFELPLMYIGNALSGIAMGGVISCGSVALVHYGQSDQFEVAFGLMATINGIISNVAGPLFGWMRDDSQSYDTVLVVTISLLGLAAILFLIAAFASKTRGEEPKQIEVELDYDFVQ